MQELEFWDRQPLSPGPVALAIFPGKPGPAALGAACSVGHRVLLAAEHFQEFLVVHAKAEILCHGAASLHWLLHDLLQKRGAAVAALWAVSRESRLIDVAILDQLVRQVRGRDCTRGRSLQELASQVGIELPAAEEARQKIAAASPPFARAEDREALLLGLRLVDAIRQVYDRLAREAAFLQGAAERASQRPSYRHSEIPPKERDKLAAGIRKLVECIVARRAPVSPDGHGSQPLPDTQQEEEPKADSSGQAPCPFGLLGIGIEVQAAVVEGWLARQDLHVQGQARWKEVCAAAEDQFREASSRLYRDRRMHGLFKWGASSGGDKSRLVRRDPESREPVTAGEPFRQWLRDVVPDELRDCHGCPTLSPFPSEDDPPNDPERWGPLADAHPGLRAWRDLVWAARVAALSPLVGTVRVAYEIIPYLRSVRPSLAAIREIAGNVFTPTEGHIFLVGSLEDLRTRCLLALCRMEDPFGPGTLDRWYFGWQQGASGAEEAISPIEALTADFLIMINAADLDAAEAALRERFQQRLREQKETATEQTRDKPSPAPHAAPRNCTGSVPHGRCRRWAQPPDLDFGPDTEDSSDEPANADAEDAYAEAREAFEKAIERFILLRQQNHNDYRRWVSQVRDLLEALPLGLEGSRLREFLLHRGDWWQGVSAEEVERYAAVLSRRLATELAAFQDLDVFNRLAEELSQPTSRVVVGLDGQHTPAQILHHLMHLRKPELVWQLVEAFRPTKAGGGQISDSEVATRLLWWMTVTRAGRVVGPGFLAATRREQYLAAADEVRKAVAYALVAEGYPLVAVTEDGFLLEVPHNRGCSSYLPALSQVVMGAQQRLLGPLAAPVSWDTAVAW